MAILKLFAQIACSDLATSGPWFERLLGRPCDAAPMSGLQEWHHGDAGLQLFEQPENAGHTTLTLMVADLAAEWARLEKAVLSPSQIEHADYVDIIRLRDPDGNLIVLAQPRG